MTLTDSMSTSFQCFEIIPRTNLLINLLILVGPDTKIKMFEDL